MKYVQYDARGACTNVISHEGSAFMPDKSGAIPVGDSVEAEDLPNLIVRSGKVTQKADLGQAFDKTTLTANMSDMAHIDGLPKGTFASVQDMGQFTIDDGVIDIVISEPGDYKVYVDPFPYKPFEVTIHAD